MQMQLADLSPMMKQYIKIKKENPDTLVFFRLGDFYEMFFEDAKIASKELDITLTGRDCGLKERAPMCGVPYHSVDNYISRLVSKGYSVTICEQNKAEDSNEVVGREVVRVITPGTVTEPTMLDEKKNSYIAGIYTEDDLVCLCFIDVTTGDWFVTDVYKNTDRKYLAHLGKYSPRECYINEECMQVPLLAEYFGRTEQCAVKKGEGKVFLLRDCTARVEGQTGKKSEELNLSQSSMQLKTAGGLLEYLHRTQFCDLSHIRELRYLGDSNSMDIDYSTWRNLEIVETLRSKERQGSLLGVIDKTRTAMGARQLRRFLEKPLTDLGAITQRQEAVKMLVNRHRERTELRDLLGNVRDIQRLTTKIVYDTINPRDTKNLSFSFASLPQIREKIQNMETPLLKRLYAQIDGLEDLYMLIESAIRDDPPVSIRDGKIIREGFNKELDELRQLQGNTKEVLANMVNRERERTGIKNMKIGYNKIIGYYLEITKLNVPSVPEEYIRKQSLVNAERFVTPELKELEVRLASASEQIVQLEYQLYCELKQKLTENQERIRSTADAVGVLDTLQSLAYVAVKNNYTCPFVDSGDRIEIRNGRHPVVEKMLRDEMFVPNDTFLDRDTQRTAVITGPNMAGKSTYMRQVALIVLLAQIGSFVPASSATIGLTDKIFTRVGASDDLAMGQSTFMVEMSEVAYIVKHATRRSLMIFDEIGRGTSTFDGMSIARAVLEYVTRKIGGKSLFATHYHELIALEKTLPGIKNYNIAAKKKGKDILFLRKIVEGGADDSYGVEVARLAGVPEEIIRRAEEVLIELESGKQKQELTSGPQHSPDDLQLSMGDMVGGQILEKLKQLDVTVLTPIEAMNELYQLVKTAKEV